MSIVKQFLKSRPECKVKFRVSKGQAGTAQSIHLVGDFNSWDQTTTPMKRLKSGDFTAIVYLNRDEEYQFRYLVDGEEWINDDAPDGMVPTKYPGEMNSVINTTVA